MNGTTERIRLRDNPTGQALILVTLALMALGVVMVFSTTGLRPSSAEWYYRRDIRQAIFAGAALVLLLTLWRVDYHRLGRASWAWSFLGLGLALAAVTLVWGHAVGGKMRWLRYGPLGFQPSEILKFALLIFVAATLSRPSPRAPTFLRRFLPVMVLTAAACGLVVTQNFGTAAIIGLAAGAVMVMGGVPLRVLLILALLAGAGFYFFVVRNPMRSGRMEAMVAPVTSTLPAVYQPRQSILAIASGAEPAGPGGGPSKYGYLPESSTDFIFSPLTEEMGLPGAMIVIGLFLTWLALAWKAAVNAPDPLGALLAGGMGFVIATQAALHVAVAVRWAPPTGVALPFMSAGGTGLLLMSAATAVIVSVTSRRAVELVGDAALAEGELAGTAK